MRVRHRDCPLLVPEYCPSNHFTWWVVGCGRRGPPPLSRRRLLSPTRILTLLHVVCAPLVYRGIIGVGN